VLICRLQGLEDDLGMAGNDYNLALCLFFVTYVPLPKASGLVDTLDTSYSKCLPISLYAKSVHRSSSRASCSAGESYSPSVPQLILLDHDVDGHCQESHRSDSLSRLPRNDGGGLFPRCSLLLDSVVSPLSRVTKLIPGTAARNMR